MIKPRPILLEDRLELEKKIMVKFPDLALEWSPAFRHYYIQDKGTGERSDNISYWELLDRYKKGEFRK